MQTSRPAVTVTPSTNEAGDLTHCDIQVGDSIIKAPFSEPHTELMARVQESTGVELTVAEVMAVTNASRHQMVREAERLKDVLLGLPAGTVAIVEGGMSFWLDAAKELVWDESFTIGEGKLTPGYISCIGEIDTDELWDIAESIRRWLSEPRTEPAEVHWLHQMETGSL